MKTQKSKLAPAQENYIAANELWKTIEAKFDQQVNTLSFEDENEYDNAMEKIAGELDYYNISTLYFQAEEALLDWGLERAKSFPEYCPAAFTEIGISLDDLFKQGRLISATKAKLINICLRTKPE